MRALALLTLTIAGCAIDPPPPAVMPVPVEVERPPQRVRANGIELAWDSFGDEHAPPLLLIMGLGMQMIGWPDQLC